MTPPHDPDRPSPADRPAGDVPPRGLMRRARAWLRGPSAPSAPPDGSDMDRQMLARTDRLFDRLERVADGLEGLVRLEKTLLERMVPIVDDLGELVRHELDRVRKEAGLQPKARVEATDASDPNVVDAEVVDR